MTQRTQHPATRPSAPRIPKPAIAAPGPKAAAALGRLELWAAHVLDARQAGDGARRELAARDAA